MKGTIVRFFPDKAFGFIRSNNEEYFFHIDSIMNLSSSKNEIKIGAEVDFEPTEGKKGLRAEEVIL